MPPLEVSPLKISAEFRLGSLLTLFGFVKKKQPNWCFSLPLSVNNLGESDMGGTEGGNKKSGANTPLARMLKLITALPN
jgi:hypothetical protein